MDPIKINKELRLIPLRAESSGIIFKTIDNNREYLRQWMPFVDFTLREEDTKKFIDQTLKADSLKKDMIFEIICNTKFCGLVSLKEVDFANKKTELGYWLTMEKQGRGIMINSCRAIIHYAFNVLKLNRITIKCAVENEKSQQIPFRLKFEFEGTERQGELLNGKFVDLKVYSLLKKEWLKHNKQKNPEV